MLTYVIDRYVYRAVEDSLLLAANSTTLFLEWLVDKIILHIGPYQGEQSKRDERKDDCEGGLLIRCVLYLEELTTLAYTSY